MGLKTLGFTFAEIMIVVAIISMLAAVALPAYQHHLAQSINSACLAEARSYSSTSLSDLLVGEAPGAPALSACAHMDTVIAIGVDISAT